MDKTLCVVDNSPDKQGSFFDICGRKIKVEAPDILERLSDYVILIIVSVQYQEKICRQLEEMGLPMDTECYSLPLMLLSFDETDNSAVDEYFMDRREQVIPSKIHSFWFSGEEKPDLYKRCIESWYKYCPEFEIIAWMLVLCVFIVVIYYMIILGWDFAYLLNSFNFGWGNDPASFFTRYVEGVPIYHLSPQCYFLH